jgi:hypothetical protein
MRSIFKGMAYLCLALTLWSAAAFVAHHHSNAIESAQCTVCIAAHSASPKPAVELAATAFVPIDVYRAKPLSAKQRLVSFALSVRPPPTV